MATGSYLTTNYSRSQSEIQGDLNKVPQLVLDLLYGLLPNPRIVKKKDGKSRVCIDYRRLNRKLIKDNYPLPLIDDILDCLQNAKIFTTLDLKNGFFHVAVNERSRKFTSFVTHDGQYQFRRMSFGLSTCPSTFMRYINAIFRHLILKSIVLPYMDDFIIPAANESQALEYLKIVLQVACDYGLEINFKKCQFLHNTIEFLGHIIENGRLFPSPSKTKAVINYPDLKNIKEVTSQKSMK
ncbi:retrovirus-related Pol polyprotein from transposon 297 [Trichonephila clavipes]|nr:retrovirus-related Pol polyprotein from transposon 297 [Trichonephila clavipes]